MDIRWIATVLMFLIISMVYLKKNKRDLILEKILIVLYICVLFLMLYSPLIFKQNGTISVTFIGISSVSKFKLCILNKQFITNLLITIPLGIIIRRKKGTLVQILLLGMGLEFVQYIVSTLFYMNRVFDINDILANTLGLIIGYFIMKK